MLCTVSPRVQPFYNMALVCLKSARNGKPVYCIPSSGTRSWGCTGDFLTLVGQEVQRVWPERLVSPLNAASLCVPY